MITDDAVESVAKELFAPQLALIALLRPEVRPGYVEALHDHVRLALKLASLQSPPAAAPERDEPKDGDERVENWGSGYPGSELEKMTLRYSAEAQEWLVVGECRLDAYDGNAAVRYDQKTDRPEGGTVPICDALGGHVGWREWSEWVTWEIIDGFKVKDTASLTNEQTG